MAKTFELHGRRMTLTPDSLTTYTKEEWRDVMTDGRPDITDEQFDEMWGRFLVEKERKARQ
jgi:hypothetical protein